MCGALESLKKQGIEQGIKQGIEQEKQEIILQINMTVLGLDFEGAQ